MTRPPDVHPALRGGPYQGYVYAYPHKSAYRRLDPPRPLKEAWAAEVQSGLFLYVHVPFCTMRCGFCNLFTTPNPKDGLVTLYLDALQRQAETVRAAIPDSHGTIHGCYQFANAATPKGTLRVIDTGAGAKFPALSLQPPLTPAAAWSGPAYVTAEQVVELFLLCGEFIRDIESFIFCFGEACFDIEARAL